MKYSKYLSHFEKKYNSQASGRASRSLRAGQPEWARLPWHVGDSVQVGFVDNNGTKSPREARETAQKKRVQFFEGIVIAIRGDLPYQKMVTIRRPGSYGIERILASNSPQIQNLQILKSQNKSRRSKLFYLRKRIGKAAFG
uniref:Ribosomal protein L19 n=1 Tax=Caulerpa cliftonii TaxID=1004391 RepID=A0A1C9JBW7_9CHLO|nr:ribosomal protein L19 [Caulerpa cliftonii]AOP19338.1 ribosomal protein L19 [Caulerpa cliftonii]